jgi:hypothetical protein
VAQSERAIDRAARAKAEKSGFGAKAWCFIFGHHEDVWQVEVSYQFDPPVILGGREVSDTGPIPEERKWCRRCGKILW